jgi:hypothetical protein
MVLKLDKNEFEHLRKMMSLFCRSKLFPMHSGDWAYQLLIKLHPDMSIPPTSKPTEYFGYGHVLPDQTFEKINVSVGEVLTDYDRDEFQILTFYHIFSNEKKTEATTLTSYEVYNVREFVKVHTVVDDTTLSVSEREIVNNALNVGTYEYSDYLIHRALKRKE